MNAPARRSCTALLALVCAGCGSSDTASIRAPGPGEALAALRGVPVGASYGLRADITNALGGAHIEVVARLASIQGDTAIVELSVQELSTFSTGKAPNRIFGVEDAVRWTVAVDSDQFGTTLTAQDSDPTIVADVQLMLNTVTVNNCRLPDRGHRVGDTWTESKGAADETWEVRAARVHDGAAWASYHYRVEGPAQPGRARGAMIEVDQELRLDDGFVGTCVINTNWDAADGGRGHDAVSITTWRIG